MLIPSAKRSWASCTVILRCGSLLFLLPVPIDAIESSFCSLARNASEVGAAERPNLAKISMEASSCPDGFASPKMVVQPKSLAALYLFSKVNKLAVVNPTASPLREIGSQQFSFGILPLASG